MLTQLLRISRQAGLLSKCLIGGARTSLQAQNVFSQIKPPRRYKSDSSACSHDTGVDLETRNLRTAIMDGPQAKVIENAKGPRATTSMMTIAPYCERISGIPARHHAITDSSYTPYTTNRLIGLELKKLNNLLQVRSFHAKGSKVRYLDFRYRFNTCHLRSHLLIIRRQKMKKHQKRKWRKKYKSVIAKMRLKREIAKEKTFRVELLTMIKRAEQFDPREYALKKIQEINSRPRELTPGERLEQIKQLIRENRYQVDYVKPKHRRIED